MNGRSVSGSEEAGEPAPEAADLPAAREPTAAELAEVFGRGIPAARQAKAEKLLGRRNVLGVRLNVATAAGVESVEIHPDRGMAVSDAVRAVCDWLRPELLTLLRPKPAPADAAGGGGVPARAVAPVPRDKAHEARGLIGRLSLPSADAADVEAAARALSGVFGPTDEDAKASLETYRGLAAGVRSGGLPPDVLVTAFDEACRLRKVRKSRGAAFIATVKRVKGEHLRATPAT